MVTVLVVTRDGAAYLPVLLKSISGQTVKDFTSLFLDNGSKDNSVTLVADWLKTNSGSLSQRDQNTGFAAAYNNLIQKLQTPYVLVLNQDVALAPDYLSLLVRAAEVNANAGSFSGSLLRADNHSATDSEPLLDAFGLTLFRNHRVVETLRGQRAALVNGNKDTEVFGVPATAALYRRAALDAVVLQRNNKVEYFDEDFFAYKEDIDLAYRLQLAGWGSLVVPGAIAYHHRSVRGEADRGHAYNEPLTAAKVRAMRSEQSNYRSYRNHLFFLAGTAYVPLLSRSFFETLFYELGKFFYVLFSNPSQLKALREVIPMRKALSAKRKHVYQKAEPRRVTLWMNNR